MIEYLKTWAELKYDRRAVTALEYGLVAAGLIVVIGGAMVGYGANLKTAFGDLLANGFGNGTGPVPTGTGG